MLEVKKVNCILLYKIIKRLIFNITVFIGAFFIVDGVLYILRKVLKFELVIFCQNPSENNMRKKAKIPG